MVVQHYAFCGFLIFARDETIHSLAKATEEKDKTIQTKVDEIEEMKKIVEQTKKYASRLHKQVLSFSSAIKVEEPRKIQSLHTIYQFEKNFYNQILKIGPLMTK